MGKWKSQARMTFQAKIHPHFDPIRELRVYPHTQQESWAFILVYLSSIRLQWPEVSPKRGTDEAVRGQRTQWPGEGTQKSERSLRGAGRSPDNVHYKIVPQTGKTLCLIS